MIDDQGTVSLEFSLRRLLSFRSTSKMAAPRFLTDKEIEASYKYESDYRFGESAVYNSVH